MRPFVYILVPEHQKATDQNRGGSRIQRDEPFHTSLTKEERVRCSPLALPLLRAQHQ